MAAATIAPADAFAHGGGLDKYGCHNDRKRGGYHCHGSGRSPASSRPQQSSAKPRKPAKAQSLMQSSVYYANCSEARAVGAAPLKRGEPGYRPKMDRDGDGVACE
ncbi:excalibur calcium-binding domain-containing protein [Asticcacaulis sp. BE141]|uniref:excalibur calcium-binding domain-containing protein n=1 Tax=Asticcacaulis TaxID=76890 RepID=UPI003857B14A